MGTTFRLPVILLSIVSLLSCKSDAIETPDLERPFFARSDWTFDWSAPVSLGPVVNSASLETGPALSADGLSLYFQSNRPGGFGLSDIWVSQRASLGSPWETPVNVGGTINTASAESLPIPSHDGHLLFFSSERPGGAGSSDIYLAHRIHTHDDFGWGAPVALGPDVNTADFEAAPWYAPTAEAGRSNLYFSRGPNNLDADIYSVAITRDGETLGPAELVADISTLSPISDAHPSLSVDGREVVFYSNRPGGLGAGDLWIATRPNVHAQWSTPVNLGAPINTAGVDVHPAFSFDGRILLWSSDRAGSIGNRDLWMATRSPSGK